MPNLYSPKYVEEVFSKVGFVGSLTGTPHRSLKSRAGERNLDEWASRRGWSHPTYTHHASKRRWITDEAWVKAS